ncbi:hypothetical protein DTO195F2_7809 [Paecilomyces variotii]|nr:hypothetical protein DTO195F2_7809 [Paecilomyces variotii]KAJ9374723.1 hypothetical protein DTO282E5_806 [Paecilomyces variotii]KAJ9398024.1 hypothetical protein DTO282F9_5141 [Paecilomyces variotii]
MIEEPLPSPYPSFTASYSIPFSRLHLLCIMESLRQDPDGFSGLGEDGVWRNFDKNGAVLSYRVLNSKEVAGFLDMFPRKTREHGKDVMDDIEQLMLISPPSRIIGGLEINAY